MSAGLWLAALGISGLSALASGAWLWMEARDRGRMSIRECLRRQRKARRR